MKRSTKVHPNVFLFLKNSFSLHMCEIIGQNFPPVRRDEFLLGDKSLTHETNLTCSLPLGSG